MRTNTWMRAAAAVMCGLALAFGGVLVTADWVLASETSRPVAAVSVVAHQSEVDRDGVRQQLPLGAPVWG